MASASMASDTCLRMHEPPRGPQTTFLTHSQSSLYREIGIAGEDSVLTHLGLSPGHRRDPLVIRSIPNGPRSPPTRFHYLSR
jgi:hypothetical protein